MCPKHSSPNYLDRSCHVSPTANTLPLTTLTYHVMCPKHSFPNYVERSCHVFPTANTLPLTTLIDHVMCSLLQTLFP